jgi:hypothetical protein
LQGLYIVCLPQAKAALLDAYPCLLDLAEQAPSEAAGSDGAPGMGESNAPGFSSEYLGAVLDEVKGVIEEDLKEVELLKVDQALDDAVRHPHIFLKYMLEKENREAIAAAVLKASAEEIMLSGPDTAR